MRALEPDESGYVERGGVKIYYEAFGKGSATVLLMPTWSIVHSRTWKGQVPYLARHFRVITFDGRGNGKSDRPSGAAAYATQEFVDDAIAVMDATGSNRVVVVGFSAGGHRAAVLAAQHPERVGGAVLIAPTAPFGPSNPHMSKDWFLARHTTEEGWAKYNQYFWRRDYRAFVEFFFSQVFVEPHSTKQIEDSIGWALETTPDVLVDTILGRLLPHNEGEDLYRSIACPVLVLHGDQDRVVPFEKGKLVAELTRGEFVTLEGSGHVAPARDPVQINRLIHEFAGRVSSGRNPTRVVRRGLGRQKRVLYLSSPIGLGHARRDLAIARELRQLHAGLQVDWLTQHPVTELLDRAGERVHPASKLLVNESRHIESEAGEHDLHAFQALRRMDEILVANFMLFQEVVEAGNYDLIVADESWDVDHFWHEHPELKSGTLAWFTDFVGFVPMPSGQGGEAVLTADYNAEMIEHIARYPRVRDRSIFVGNVEDIVDRTFGPGLPDIRSWTVQHFDFCGYITGLDPAESSNRVELRHRFGYRPDEKVCLVSVGGSGVGLHLLRRVIQAVPEVRRRVPELRVLVVAGPRIDPAALPPCAGVEICGFLPDLHKRHAACDLAIVQGGLTTCMELTAAKTPFIYFPLHNHFEQSVHVRFRLERYGAGRAMDYATSTPEQIADAIVQELVVRHIAIDESKAAQLQRPAQWRDVETDGAARAAKLLATMI